MIPDLAPPSATTTATIPGGAALRTILGLILVLWLVLPLIPVALWAVAGTWRAPDVLPGSFGLQGITALLSPQIGAAFGTSLLLGLCVAAAATPLGLMGALAARGLPRAPGRVLEAVLLAPLAIPPFALVMGVNVVLLRLYTPAFLGTVLVLVVTAMPYTAFMFRSALASYDDRFDEVARSLGASRWQAVRHVRLPLLAGAGARAAFLAFLVGWGDYITTLLVGGGQLRTLPLILASAASATGNEQFTAALSLAVVVPPLLLLAALSAPRLRNGATR